MMIARAVVLLAAIAGIALLAGDLRVARDVKRAVELSEGGPSRTEAAAAIALLRRAAARTDDTAPLLREAQLQLFLGHPREAIPPVREALRREPENAQAWLLLAQGARGAGDAPLERHARARVAELVARPSAVRRVG